MSAQPPTPLAAPAHRAPDLSLPLLEGSVGDRLREIAARHPGRTALAWAAGEGVRTMAYAELLGAAEQVAFWLLDRASPGDRIAIWSRNSLEWMLLEYGCGLAGMVVTGWNPAWSDYECEHARDLTEPALLLAGHDTRGVELLSRAEALGEPGKVFPLERLRTLAAGAVARELPPVGAADLFLIQFTSGTTGRAKGAALSHRAALNAAWLRAQACGADETEVWLNPSPMNHVGGAVTMLLGAMVTGACYVVMNRFEPGEYLRLMTLLGATRVGGVPTVLLSLLDHPVWTPGTGRLRSIGIGGTQVPRPLIERLTREFAAPVLNAYAQSECPIITSSVPGDDAATLAETVGQPAPHVELKVTDPSTGRTLALGEVGEVLVRGPMVMDGYYRMAEATAATIDGEGFLHTGDLGSLDARGYLRIHGRAREVIIRGGENIYPAEVEDALLRHPDVAAVAVVGAPDERFGQQVAAAVIPRAGSTLTAEALEAHAATRLAHFKVPRAWRFVSALPLTASGKVRKVEVEAMFGKASG